MNDTKENIKEIIISIIIAIIIVALAFCTVFGLAWLCSESITLYEAGWCALMCSILYALLYEVTIGF